MDKKHVDFLMKSVEANRDLMLAAERHIWANPETGYREWKTTEYLEKEYEKLGYTLVKAGNIPGFYTDIDTGRPGPKICIMGEMDSLLVSDHPECDKETGAVHACGHHAQSASLLGVAATLKMPGVLDNWCGSIRLMAVPAEELIEIGYREELRKKGIIKYFGGKVEFLYRGYYDGVDIAYMVHQGNLPVKGMRFAPGNNGCITKNINYIGKASHAGGAPHLGINALYAANLGLQAVNSLRETFKDNDHIRFHPIITSGGGAVNTIPHDVKVESYVRGATIEAITEANDKINRALAGTAAAMGANVMLSDRPGYLPLNNNKDLTEISVNLMKELIGEENVLVSNDWGTGCTDMGDISSVMPAIHPHVGGASGTGHGNDYQISDPDCAVVLSTKYLVALTDALLSNGAEKANEVIKNAKVLYPDKKDFFAQIDKIFMDKAAVTPTEDGKLVLDFKK